MVNIVFCHVGASVTLPEVMVRSLTRHNPEVRIIQVTDLTSPQVEGVDEVHRAPWHGDIMLFRMQGYAAVEAVGPTWFLDTDMICQRPLDYAAPEGVQAAVCAREFGVNQVFVHERAGVSFSEYEGRKIGDVFPYVGCAAYVDGSAFWSDCLEIMESLDSKWHNWWGDQEAIRRLVQSKRHRLGVLPETRYACLPEFQDFAEQAYLCHYKGAQRKDLMLDRARSEGLI